MLLVVFCCCVTLTRTLTLRLTLRPTWTLTLALTLTLTLAPTPTLTLTLTLTHNPHPNPYPNLVGEERGVCCEAAPVLAALSCACVWTARAGGGAGVRTRAAVLRCGHLRSLRLCMA